VVQATYKIVQCFYSDFLDQIVPEPKNFDARSWSLEFEYRLHSPGFRGCKELTIVELICAFSYYRNAVIKTDGKQNMTWLYTLRQNHYSTS